MGVRFPGNNLNSYRWQKCDPDTDNESKIKMRVIVISLCHRMVHHPGQENILILSGWSIDYLSRHTINIILIVKVFIVCGEKKSNKGSK